VGYDIRKKRAIQVINLIIFHCCHYDFPPAKAPRRQTPKKDETRRKDIYRLGICFGSS
jgi:hypothetical protein